VSLDVYLTGQAGGPCKCEECGAEHQRANGPGVYWANITHNLSRMADAAGLYCPLWRPGEIGIERAAQLIDPLEEGLARLRVDADTFKAMEPANGWGTYDGLISFVRAYLAACRKHPDATVGVSR
jgi:hypothetical protein